MKFTLALAALAATASAATSPKPGQLVPAAPAPAGCVANFNGDFEITVVNVTTAKRDLNKRAQCGGAGTLVISLANGILTDSVGRTGEIVANRQFQFDITDQLQPGAIYTGGFSICPNSTLALGGSTIFYQCLSGTFYNLYDQSLGGQCNEIYIEAIPCSGGGAAPAPPATSVSTVGTAPAVVTSASTTPAATTTATPTTVATSTSSAVVLSESSGGQVAMPTVTVASTTTTVAAATTTAVVATTTTAATSTGSIATGAAAAATAGLGNMAALAAGVMAVAML